MKCRALVVASLSVVVALVACGGPTYMPPGPTPGPDPGEADAAQPVPKTDGPTGQGMDGFTLPDLPPAKMDMSGGLPDAPVVVPDAYVPPLCGNGAMDPGESCDDGNTSPGDCCDGQCHLEPHCSCPTAGMMCMSTIVCGDSKKDGSEACDDGNAMAGDGCSADCRSIEAGWICDVVGQPCRKSMVPPVCGDSKIGAGENCDDGNTAAGDGCSATCQVEGPQWDCPMPGKLCVLNQYCGDGKINQDDQCDDGNTDPGDGCDGACKFENPAIWDCSQEGVKCKTKIICGDSKIVGDEVCDDGNTMAGDGCSADCKQVDPGYTCPHAADGTGGMCMKVPMPICGDAKIAFGEFCDDGNSNDNDGCSHDCKVEAGWVCPTVGMACHLKEECGDGRLAPVAHEQCDDGNKVDNDGCSHTCTIEPNFRCPEAGKPCVSTIKCGDGRVSPGETCDDRGVVPGDGCDANCHLERGWTCTGGTCKTTCGDGIMAGTESCDDHNTVSGDGCSSDCKLESPGPTERNAWMCAEGQKCVRTTCGNGIVEGSEQCDKTDSNTGDGCSPFCRKEPLCPSGGGACKTQCGDGLLIAGIDTDQECDDGNTVSGDGCSSTCKVEAGYMCTPQPVVQNPLIIPIVYRDFKAKWQTNGHPDFEAFGGSQTGIVGAMLGADGKPVYNAPNQSVTTGATAFNQWYRDDASVNKTIFDVLTLPAVGNGFQFNTDRFFPIDNKPDGTVVGWGNYVGDAQHTPWLDHDNKERNFHFTSEFRYWFQYKGDEQFDFTGDDDVWVYVNKILTVDLGGVHGPKVGNLTIDTTGGIARVCDEVTTDCANRRPVMLGLVKGQVYEIVMFQAERHTQGSVYRLTLSNFSADRSVCKTVCGNGVRTPDEECDDGTANNTGGYGKCNPNCTVGPRCGDGHVDAGNGEECDDGVNGGVYGGQAQVCGQDCKWAPRCGDGKVDSSFGEACDKGTAMNNGAYGGCNADCTLGPFCGDGAPTSPQEECDPAAVANPTVATACSDKCVLLCGNGIMDPNEECDDGKANNTGGYGKCNANCTRGPRCGDGVPNGPEECDDGKNDGAYGRCAPGCKLGPRCGDSMVQPAGGEICDLGSANSATAYGREKCTNRCRPAPYCGDGALNSNYGEICDDGIDNTGAPGKCKADCSGRVPNPFCGDGMKQSDEQCDDGDANGTMASTCDANCRMKCGNGAPDPGEKCDLGAAQNTGAYGTCNPDCTLAPYCGDGVKNGVEQCDLAQGNEANPYGPGKCTTACTTAPYCGDGRIDTAFKEECDSTPRCDNMCKAIIFE